jgi:deoxyribonuclease V
MVSFVDEDTTAAERQQARLAKRVDLANAVRRPPSVVAGLDVSYASDRAGSRGPDRAGSQGPGRAAAAAVLIDVARLAVIEHVVVYGQATFPYVPGLLAFREAPLLIDALSELSRTPDVLVCDGYGIAHPRRFGLASHLGVLTGLPSMGVAKTPFTGSYEPPGIRRGDWSPLVEGDTVLGRVLRTQDGVKPVFVSVGHRIGLDEATELTLRLCGRYRLPETTRRADHLSREALRAL